MTEGDAGCQGKYLHFLIIPDATLLEDFDKFRGIKIPKHHE